MLVPHAALRVNTNPYNPNLGVVRTVNLAMDDPDNFGIDSLLSGVNVTHGKQKDFQLTEALSQFSPRVRRFRNFGSRLLVNIEAVCFIGLNAAGDLSTGAQRLVQLLDDIDTMTGHQDGVSQYLWYSPNYRWHTPAEQWILMVPKTLEGPVPTLPHPWGMSFKLALESERNYKAITWAEYRRGFANAGAGTVTLTIGFPTVVGVGTAFLTDFIYGDQLYSAAGVLLGTVLSVQSDLAMTLQANAGANFAGAYRYQQRSAPSYYVPVYTLTEYAAHQGWGLTPWGENWGDPAP